MKQVVRKQVALAGRLVDGVTGRSIAGARVDLVTVPVGLHRVLDVQRLQHGKGWDRLDERTDRTRTDAAGTFCFLDLPSGTYGLTATFPAGGRRYAPTKGTAIVKRNRAGDVTPAWVELRLPATTVAGRVTGPGSRPVVLASVQVRGEPERVYTNNQGQYLLTGLEPGERTIVVGARGFGAVDQQVTLAKAGSSKTVNVALKPTAS